MDLNSKRHMNLLFPQWQGSGPENTLYYGAKKIQQHFDFIEFETIPVPERKPLRMDNAILGYEDILGQLKACTGLLTSRTPESIMVIGGDCGVEPGPVTYLNKRLDNDLALVWFDAHGDLNTPASSPSGHFHGMPLRTIYGEGNPAILTACASTLSPGQVILAGARQFDPPESEFIKTHGIACVSCSAMETSSRTLSHIIAEKGFQHAYIHIDLDVLDPAEFKEIKHPTPGGIGIDTLIRTMKDLAGCVDIAGMGIVEYTGETGSGLPGISRIVQLFTQGSLS